MDELSMDACLIVDTFTIAKLYIEYFVSIVTHYTSGKGITFIAMVQHCVHCVLVLCAYAILSVNF